MIYPVLAACVILAGFATVISFVSLAAFAGWRARRESAGVPGAAGVFHFRGLPTAVASVVAAACLYPAFHHFEPRGTDEMPGWTLGACALIGILLIGNGLRRGWAAWRFTRALERTWLRDGQPLQLAGWHLPAFRIVSDSPVVAIIGIWRPRLYISQSVLDACSSEELAAIVAHESAHVAAFDNLRLLAFRSWPDLLAFTRVGQEIERYWSIGAEAAADHFAAAHDKARRLHLASALLRVAALSSPSDDLPLVASTFYGSSNVANRVKRLLDNTPLSPGRSRWVVGVWAVLLGSLLTIALWLPETLRPVHEVVEFAVTHLP